MKVVFPDATRYLCVKHLRDNMGLHLKDKVGVDLNTRRLIDHEVFGDQGLANANDTITFEERSNTPFLEKVLAAHPAFIPYFERTRSLLEEFVTVPHSMDSHDTLWTNNNW